MYTCMCTVQELHRSPPRSPLAPHTTYQMRKGGGGQNCKQEQRGQPILTPVGTTIQMLKGGQNVEKTSKDPPVPSLLRSSQENRPQKH